MSNTSYALIMLAAGVGIPVLAALNAQLGRLISAPAAASVVLFAVAFLCALVVVMLTGPAALAKIPSSPKHLMLAGVLIAFYVLTITYIAPHFGIGNAVFFVLLGQLISAALIDHFALFGAVHSPLTPTRAAGIAVMAAGVFLTQITGRA
ncbi:DMT family transporter [Litoreibacter arenae]|uniref:Integral membrane protein n=1 Tax=Litoreibacter arenae DSM 19593 TaxID=1123360 RepID=S9QNZ1_9RHOB|nr:DMT family transporter [Litoreibacter arenae]EPX81328.1 Integral membrane protein [Litoreibacter arenae DSM 19593]